MAMPLPVTPCLSQTFSFQFQERHHSNCWLKHALRNQFLQLQLGQVKLTSFSLAFTRPQPLSTYAGSFKILIYLRELCKAHDNT